MFKFFGWLSDIAITADSDEACLAAVIFTLLCIFFLKLSVTFLLRSAQEYYEAKEDLVTEYNFNRKIIIREENNAAKADTVYFFEKKNRQTNKSEKIKSI